MEDDQNKEEDPKGAGDADAAEPVLSNPMVGLGGSAGAIAALCRFFDTVPPDTGVTFVVVVHLSADQDSGLAGILQRHTAMPVIQVRETLTVVSNHVYVIPPAKILLTLDGKLVLQDAIDRRQQHIAVDLFFRTLADTHGPNAAAIVLSGINGDGALGLRRVKERGGLTIVQDPQEAEYDGMPRAAIATGMVDWILRTDEMGERLREYLQLGSRLRLPRTADPDQGLLQSRRAGGGEESELLDVLSFLRTRTGRDFSHYKRATILRRIGRRMQVNGIETFPDYLHCLRTRPGEAGALLQDLLISVTNFFRDPDCYAALERLMPVIFRGKTASHVLRIWVAACATGEEAYSIAILVNEFARTLESAPQIQIFATDLDEDAIRVAREGVYPVTIEADVSEERLRRHFSREHRGYRVRRELRETVLFAVHDVLKDSPFSRVDLVSCRNLLIYLSRQAQNQVLQTFHFSLVAGGHLFLGSSESVDDGNALFAVIDKKRRLYVHRATPRTVAYPPAGPSALVGLLQNRQLPAPVAIAGSGFNQPHVAARPTFLSPENRAASWGELHLKLLEELAPPSMLVDAEYDIVHLSATVGRYLQYGGGEVSRNLLRTIHPGLRIELRAALYQSGRSGTMVQVAPLRIEMGADVETVQMTVKPASKLARGLLLVFIRSLKDDDGAASAAPLVSVSVGEPEPLAQHLDQELDRLKSHLRDTVEQYEASTEELKASNEELQAMNEELRSATEELETSREELQSINEELTTVNHELKNKVDELGSSNSDMQNLMDATAIATIFLDREFKITRYTPSAVSLFNLIPTDVGRPLSDLTSRLDYPDLSADARLVLERLVPVEREVGMTSGEWFMVRALPYRTIDDRIAGVVLTFVDISERKRSQEALRRSEARFSAIVNEAPVGVLQVAMDGRISLVNRYFRELLGYSEDELLGRNAYQLFGISALSPDAQSSVGKPAQAEVQCDRRDGTKLWLQSSTSLLRDTPTGPASALIVCTDVTERKRAEEMLRASEERLRLMIENAVDYAIFSTDLERRVTMWNIGAARLLGYSESEILGQRCDIVFTEEDRAANVPQEEARRAMTEGRAADDRMHLRKDGSRFWASGALMPMHDPTGRVRGFVKILRDQSTFRQAQEQLETSQAELLGALADKELARAALEASDRAKGQFLAILSHELRNPLAAINGAAQVISAPATSPEDLRSASEVIERQADVMKTLLSDLLDMSRLRLGKLVLHRETVGVAAFIEAAVETCRPLIESMHHRLTVRVDPSPMAVFGDPVRLAQAVSNLLSNAAKFTPDGGRIALEVAREGSTVVITVADDGIGMDAATAESVFEMFFQVAQPTPSDSHIGGLGIGLALVRSIAQLHEGSVAGYSEGPGRGSRFVLTLPLSDMPVPARHDSQTKAEAGSLGGLNVLVVDDNADAVWPSWLLLRWGGWAVGSARPGVEACRLYEEFRPDVVLLDIGLPDQSGLEVARRIRAMPGGDRTTLIAATGWGQQQDQKEATEAGFDLHMIKPLSLEELARAIGRLRAAK